MSLIATARALDDQRFLWRVRAAALVTATQKVKEADGPEQDYAEYVLRYPMAADPILEATVAANAGIASLVAVTEDNVVNTEAVTDTDIIYVVAASWADLAAYRAANQAAAIEANLGPQGTPVY